MSRPRVKPKYQRILLKLSGEVLSGKSGFGVDQEAVGRIAQQIAGIKQLGVEVAIIIGGGNIVRGIQAASQGMDRMTADYMGMLATVINGLAIRDGLEKLRIPVRVLTAVEIPKLAETYYARRAVSQLKKGRVVILSGGTGSPYFSTDTAAALRAVELNAEVMLKATNVDGVYSADPHKNPRPRLFKEIKYMEVVRQRLQVMDITAITLCMENNIPLIVFNFKSGTNMRDAVLGKRIGTRVH